MGGIARQQFADLILRGEFARAGVEAPVLEPGDRRMIAERVRERAGRPETFPDPRELAVALGLRVCAAPVRGCGGEVTNGKNIWYRWHPNARVWGLNVFHGLAHCALLQESPLATEGDAWLLTVELCVPAAEVRKSNPRSLAKAQQHAPKWLVERAFRRDFLQLRLW